MVICLTVRCLPALFWHLLQEPLPDQEHDSIHPVSIPHSAANVSEKSPSITTVAASDCKAASPLNIRYHVLKFDLGFLQATDNMKNQFSRIISLAYEEDPSNIFFANGDMTGIPLEQLFGRLYRGSAAAPFWLRHDCLLQTCDLDHSDDARLADART